MSSILNSTPIAAFWAGETSGERRPFLLGEFLRRDDEEEVALVLAFATAGLPPVCSAELNITPGVLCCHKVQAKIICACHFEVGDLSPVL